MHVAPFGKTGKVSGGNMIVAKGKQQWRQSFCLSDGSRLQKWVTAALAEDSVTLAPVDSTQYSLHSNQKTILTQ